MYEDIFLDVTTALETLGHRHGDEYFQGKWEEKHWMNTPGPIYCGDTDNCGTGPDAAPYNVALDEHSYQIIYRQPINLNELSQVWDAAWADPFSGYGADGNLHWTRETIKTWWTEQKPKVEQEVRRLINIRLVLNTNNTQAYYRELRWWQGYLQTGLYKYLQVYAFFLDNGRIPTESERLPEL